MIRKFVVLVALLAAGSMSGQTFEEKVKASEPLAPVPVAQNVSGKNISAEVCTIEGMQFLGKSNMGLMKSVEVIGDRIHIADETGKVYAFKVKGGAGCTLVPDTSFGENGVFTVNNKIEYLASDGAGTLYASTGIFGSYALKDGQVKFQCPNHYVRMHPSGTWGISFWNNSNVDAITVAGTKCSNAPWVLTELGSDDKRKGPFNNVNSVGFLGDLVLVGGVVAAKPSPRIVVAYTKDGVEKFRFGNEGGGFADDAFGWVHAVEPCKTGICGLDANGRELKLFTDEGGFVGLLELDKLFGLTYPWIPDFSMAKDGAAWFIAAQDRGKSGVAEGLVYRVKGL